MAIVITGPSPAVTSLPQTTVASVHVTFAGINIDATMVVQYGSRQVKTGAIPVGTLNTLAAIIATAIETDQGWAPGSSTVQLIAGP